ncbi:hypothetical protein GCM10017752_20750 [Streptomyces roseoviridis]
MLRPQVREDEAHDLGGRPAVTGPAQLAAGMGGLPVGDEPLCGELGEGEVGEDLLVRHVEQAEDQGGEQARAVLAGGAVEDQRSFGRGDDLQGRADLGVAVERDLPEPVGEIPPGVQGRVDLGLVVRPVLDAQVVPAPRLGLGVAALGGDLPRIAQVDHGGHAQLQVGARVRAGELGEGVRTVEGRPPHAPAVGGPVAAQVTEVVEPSERYLSSHRPQPRGRRAAR